jgi:alginate O-acetyltransferase complex protein AlgI
MLFNSAAFAAFFVISLILFWSAPQRHRVYILVGLSYFFYSYTFPIYFFLLAIITLFNFAMALEIVRRPRFARHFMWLAVAVDLFSIAFYKYTVFAIKSTGAALNFFGLNTNFMAPEITLPLGISFFTFKMISYIVDTYKGRPPEESFWNFTACISFFPPLLAGPIVKPRDLLPQIKAGQVFDGEEAIRGIFQIAQGLVKKIVFADFLGGFVDKVYAAPSDYSGLATLIAAYAYAFQIYFDFSGYTDIAIGSAKLLGFKLPINFDLPYIAKNPREFWRRWHVSLSTWLRDYLYISLGGNRKGEGRTYFNLMMTMALGGLWHGANWTFVLWGTYHGILISVQRLLEEKFEFVRKLTVSKSPVVSVLSAAVTFHLVCLGWVMFRAESLAKISAILGNIFSRSFTWESAQLPVVIMLFVAAVSHVVRGKWNMEEWYIRLPAPIQAFGYSCATVAIFLFFTTEERFIYFQF